MTRSSPIPAAPGELARGFWAPPAGKCSGRGRPWRFASKQLPGGPRVLALAPRASPRCSASPARLAPRHRAGARADQMPANSRAQTDPLRTMRLENVTAVRAEPARYAQLGAAPPGSVSRTRARAAGRAGLCSRRAFAALGDCRESRRTRPDGWRTLRAQPGSLAGPANR